MKSFHLPFVSLLWYPVVTRVRVTCPTYGVSCFLIYFPLWTILFYIVDSLTLLLIIFSSKITPYTENTLLPFVMLAALHSRCRHYILQLWFLSSPPFFLIYSQRCTDWMSIILPHMMWPYCEFRMQVWNVLHTAHWKYSTQKNAKNGHLCTIAQLCQALIFTTKACNVIRKKNLLDQYLLHMSSQYAGLSPLMAGIDWWVWGTPSTFSGFHALASLLHRRRSTEVNRTLHDVWPSPGLVHHIHFWGLFPPPNRILPGAKFTLRPSLSFSCIGSITARHMQCASAKLCGVVQGMELRNFGKGHHLYSAGWPSRLGIVPTAAVDINPVKEAGTDRDCRVWISKAAKPCAR